MKDIQDLINLTIKDKHTKLKLKNIIKFLATYYPSEKLEKYKSVIIEYVNLKNKEAEVIYT
jgi:arginyl-tRNA synthetase